MATSASHLNFLIAILLLSRVHCEILNFPKGFLIGVASSSYQTEGAWNVSDKSENIWDRFTHTKPWMIFDGSNGDEACLSYYKFREDVKLLADLGADFYRVSISWSRLLPTGFPNVVSEDGVRFYNELFDELLKHGIQPYVTLYHWDHPQVLEDMGGWNNEQMVDWFGDYARVIFREFGSKVKVFGTINEPDIYCEGASGSLERPSGNVSYGQFVGNNIGNREKYMCVHNCLKAHARAYHIYDKEFRADQHGEIGMVGVCPGVFAKDENDTAAEEVYFQFRCGWVLHPIFSETGDYPEIMKTRIAENSRILGYSRSALPEFSPEWIRYIKGSSDFLGMNHYSSYTVETVGKINGLWHDDCGVRNPLWPNVAVSRLRVSPEGFRKLLNKLKSEYNNPTIRILENGFQDEGGTNDTARISYLYSYLRQMLLAIHEDKCNITAYTVWSFLDSFEWNRGHTVRLGLVQVDFTSPNRTRTPKASMFWLQNVIRTRKLQLTYDEPVIAHTTSPSNVTCNTLWTEANDRGDVCVIEKRNT